MGTGGEGGALLRLGLCFSVQDTVASLLRQSSEMELGTGWSPVGLMSTASVVVIPRFYSSIPEIWLYRNVTPESWCTNARVVSFPSKLCLLMVTTPPT